ncbi:hypothetical protein WJX73_002159 [Symbiochloris irregularis]|uniref:RING-type E3 ubiquitin transferase n=1 Tax=Symbiochloris irregularis TaxID=706552 RepID=A0AAW1PRX1_9CHLO
MKGVTASLSRRARCSADLVVQTGNFTYEPVMDMPADFGPEIPAMGVFGLLLVAEPEDACTPLSPPSTQEPWIALIVRSEARQTNCSFDVKVQNAENAGAEGAIVYDDKPEPLLIMSKHADHASPSIPSVFVTQNAGLVLKSLLVPGTTVVTITPATDAVWLSMLLSASAGMLAVTVVVGIFYFISRRQRIRNLPGRLGYALMRGEADGMTPAELRALPIVIHESPNWHRAAGSGSSDDDSSVHSPSRDSDEGSPLGPKGGGTLKTCAICIEDYRDGNKLRVLPCKHRFHIECIDQWLSSRKPLCPICKGALQLAARTAKAQMAMGLGGSRCKGGEKRGQAGCSGGCTASIDPFKFSWHALAAQRPPCPCTLSQGA